MNPIVFVIFGALMMVSVFFITQDVFVPQPEMKFNRPIESEETTMPVTMPIYADENDYADLESSGINVNDFAPADRVDDNWVIVEDFAESQLTDVDELIRQLVEEKRIDSKTLMIQLPDTCVKGTIAGTGSMQPTMYANHTVIKCPIEVEKDLYVGDIITFEPENKHVYSVIHRIIEIGEDEKGWYCIAKGDHNKNDDGKIRFNQIEHVIVGIFY